jgi:hypothetical protein
MIHHNQEVFEMMTTLLLAFAAGSSAIAADAPDKIDWQPGPTGYRTLLIEGWKLHASTVLLDRNGDEMAKAIVLLRPQLQEIVRVVPTKALSQLREVPLWFSPEYKGVPPRAEYHPGVDWLRSQGRNPAMVKCVEFTNTRIFESETKRMPNFALHELAHAYHDRVLGFERADVAAAYEAARAAGTYNSVERINGQGVKSKGREKAYAMVNPKEYFAETSEAFFSRNDFFPFDKAELAKADPRMTELLAKLWGVTP